MAGIEKKNRQFRHFRDDRTKMPEFEFGPYGLISVDASRVYKFEDDFDRFTIAASGVTGWILQQTGSGTGAVVQDEIGGVIKFVTGTTAANDIQYSYGTNTTKHEPVLLQAGKRAWLFARFKTEDADQDTFFIGANVSIADAFAAEPADQFRFRSGATPDALQFACGKTNSTEVTISLGAMADGTYVRVAAYYDGVDTIYAYRWDDSGNLVTSGSASVTSSVTGDLLPDTELNIMFGGQTEDTGGDDFFIDYLKIYIER